MWTDRMVPVESFSDPLRFDASQLTLLILREAMPLLQYAMKA